MGAGQIILFNTQTGSVQAVLPGFPGVTGLLAVPELHRLFASVTGRHEVDVIDTLHLGGLMDNGVMGFLFGAPMILAYVLLPDAGLILLPVLTAFAAFSMWKIWPERCGFLVGYLLVFLLYDAYLVWWYSTGQKVHLEF